MLHQANIDTQTGRYYLGNIFEDPHIHGRNTVYDYFAVYGDVSRNGTGDFGFRFSGHHLGLNYRFDGESGELISDELVFLRNNPLIVLDAPPLKWEHDERADLDQFLHTMLRDNFAGIAQFAEGLIIVLAFSAWLHSIEAVFVVKFDAAAVAVD